jgi:hypothetical protein
LVESESSSRNVSRPSGSHAKSHQDKQALVPVRVQPSRTNRSNRLAEIMANIEDDDESRTAMPRRKKRHIVESDTEDASCVPEEIECNPMAPASKKQRRQLNGENPSRSIPPLLPLQPTSPAQVPPDFQPNPKPRLASRSQFHPQLQSTSESQPQPQESQRQSYPTVATSNRTNPSGIPDEGHPMQVDYANPKPRLASRSQFHPQLQSTSESQPQPQESQRQSYPTVATSNWTNPSGIPDEGRLMQVDYVNRITQGWFYFYKFLYSDTNILENEYILYGTSEQTYHQRGDNRWPSQNGAIRPEGLFSFFFFLFFFSFSHETSPSENGDDVQYGLESGAISPEGLFSFSSYFFFHFLMRLLQKMMMMRNMDWKAETYVQKVSFSFVFLIHYTSLILLQILMRSLLQRMRKLRNVLFVGQKAEACFQKVSFSAFFLKFIANIDETSPSEDDEAARRGSESGDLRPEGIIFNYFLLFLYSISSSLQILMRSLLRKMMELLNVLFMKNQPTQGTSLMITEYEIGPINHQVKNNFSMQRDASFRALATPTSPTLTAVLTKMRKKVHIERAAVDRS